MAWGLGNMLTVANTHQWDGERNQREASRGISPITMLCKFPGFEVKRLKALALLSGLRSVG